MNCVKNRYIHFNPLLRDIRGAKKNNYHFAGGVYGSLNKHTYKLNYIYNDEFNKVCELQKQLFEKISQLQQKYVSCAEKNNFVSISKKTMIQNRIELEKQLYELFQKRIEIESKRLKLFNDYKLLKQEALDKNYDIEKEEMSLVYDFEFLDLQETLLIENENNICDDIDDYIALIECECECEEDMNTLDSEFLVLYRKQNNINKIKRDIQNKVNIK